MTLPKYCSGTIISRVAWVALIALYFWHLLREKSSVIALYFWHLLREKVALLLRKKIHIHEQEKVKKSKKNHPIHIHE